MQPLKAGGGGVTMSPVGIKRYQICMSLSLMSYVKLKYGNVACHYLVLSPVSFA